MPNDVKGCISQSFEMQPPREGARVYIHIRRPIGEADCLTINVEWYGDSYTEYPFEATRHADAPAYWDLKWTGGHETLDMSGAKFEDWAEQAFRSTKAIRNTPRPEGI